MTRVVITGANGFIGANLVRRSLRDGLEVHAVVRPGSDPWRLAGLTEIHVHECDITSGPASNAMMQAVRPDLVFHLAAHGAYSWQADRAQIHAVNVAGTCNVVESAIRAGVGSVVAAGSSSEYGLKDHAPSENEVVEPNSHYAISKAAATHYCRWLSKQAQVPVTTLRLYSVYGAFEDSRRLIPTAIRQGSAGRMLDLADANTARDFVHVDDVCQAFILAAQCCALAEVFNVATGRQTTLSEVAAVCARHFGLDEAPQWGSHPGRQWDTAHWVGDATRLRALGWDPGIEFDRGFAMTAGWWARQPSAAR